MASFNAPENPINHDAAVAAGVDFLNGRDCPANWLDRINLATLDLGSIRNDLYFQIWGKGSDHGILGLTFDQAVALGFEAVDDDPVVWADLTDAWVRAIYVIRADRVNAARKVA